MRTSSLSDVLLTAINSADKKEAVKSIRSEINCDYSESGWVDLERIDLGTLVEDFAEMHKPIRVAFWVGLKLFKG